MSRDPIFLFALLFCILAACPFTHAAHSRRRVVSRSSSTARYDRSITTFDQTGRLLQVEYGMEAASRGESVVAVWTEGAIYVLVKNSSSQKVHRIDEHLWLFSSGLSGDARALASSLRSSCQQHRLSFGESSTVQQVAREAASLQHQLTRTGGARPLGCTAIVVGIDPSSSEAAGEMRVFRSDPGGTLDDCLYCAVGKDGGRLMNEVAKRYDGFESTTQAATVKELLSVMTAVSEESAVDVWILEPDSKRRGKTLARCLKNVKVADMDDVVSALEHRDNP